MLNLMLVETIARLGLARATGGPSPVPVGAVVVPFAFDTPSPALLQVVQAGSFIVRAAIQITTPFDGASPIATLGSAADPALCVIAPLGALGQYEDDEVHAFPIAELLRLTITAPGSTVGAGRVVYEIV